MVQLAKNKRVFGVICPHAVPRYDMRRVEQSLVSYAAEGTMSSVAIHDCLSELLLSRAGRPHATLHVANSYEKVHFRGGAVIGSSISKVWAKFAGERNLLY